jgi:hypothetical protein
MDMARITMLLVFAFVAAAADPIRLHPDNPHYFEYRGKPTVLITSGEHYGAVLNLDFDYKRYLKTLASDRLNLTRTFVGAYREGPESFGITANTLAPAHERFIAPWPRTEVPRALDGLTKFDLTRWNETYFARLKDFLKEAARRGIVVELTLFCPFYKDEMWDLSPLNAGNNVNGIGKYKRERVFTLQDPEMQRIQDALVKKIVSETREFDNLMYEISNEPYAYKLISAEWERHIAGVIAETEAGLPARQRHLITQNISNGSQKVPNPDPRVSVFNFHYSRPPQSVALNFDLGRPIGCNETGFDGKADATYRTQAWEFLLAGGALFNNLDYSFSPGREDGTYAYPATQPGGGSALLRKQYRVLRDFMDSINFLRMAPVTGFVQSGLPEGSSAWTMGNRGKSYALYLHHGAPRKEKPRYFVDATLRTAELTVDLPPGDYTLDWIDPKTGRVAKQDRLSHPGGLRAVISPPYKEDIALRIKARKVAP